MRTFLVAFAALMMAGCAQPEHLRRDEQVVFFPTVGYSLAGGSEWVLPVHGWVYESTWLSRNLDWATQRLDLQRYLTDPQDRATLRQRVEPFVVEGAERRKLSIVLGSQTVRLNPASSGGQLYDELRLPAAEVESLSVSPGSRVIEYRVVCSESDQRECTGRIHLFDSEGLSIVSDIDDTIRLADVNNTPHMLENTFIEAFRPVPGMAEAYREWEQRWKAQFHYISASPSQLGACFSSFLDEQGFPRGSLALRRMEWKGTGLQFVVDLFEDPVEYKLAELAWLMTTLPDRRYVLIGDSGQRDPEVYGAVARRFPAQVRLILIRDVTCCEERDSARYQSAFRDVPDRLWVLFREPAEVRSRFDEVVKQRVQTPKRPRPVLGDVFIQQLAAYSK